MPRPDPPDDRVPSSILEPRELSEDADKGDPLFSYLADTETKYRELGRSSIRWLGNWFMIVIVGCVAGVMIGGAYLLVFGLD